MDQRTGHIPFEAFKIVEGAADSGVVLLCDHARNTLPDEYGSLGLEADQFQRHIAYDIGAEALTRGLAERLNCPAVHSCFSRLLIDPNRGEDDPTIVMRLSDGTVIAGNHPISEAEIASRISRFHAPYHEAIDQVIERSMQAGVNPLVFSIHSFTPAWKGAPRPWQVAILWDADPRLNLFMIDELRKHDDLQVGDNEPYDGALKNDTMYRHCTKLGLAQSLLEVRQDQIADEKGVAKWVDILAPILLAANERADMHVIKHYGSRTEGSVNKG